MRIGESVVRPWSVVVNLGTANRATSVSVPSRVAVIQQLAFGAEG